MKSAGYTVNENDPFEERAPIVFSRFGRFGVRVKIENWIPDQQKHAVRNDGSIRFLCFNGF